MQLASGFRTLMLDKFPLCGGLEKAHIPRNKRARDRSRDSMPQSPQSRRPPFFFSYQNMTFSTLFSGEEAIVAIDLKFCQSKTTNVRNDMTTIYVRFLQPFMSIIVGMAFD